MCLFVRVEIKMTDKDNNIIGIFLMHWSTWAQAVLFFSFVEIYNQDSIIN